MIGLIPARAGSTRIPNKNVASLGGHPLIAWTIHAARESGVFDRVVVSSDSRAIGAFALEYGACWLQRPERMAGPLSPDVEWLQHARAELGLGDQFAILRPTSPFRDADTIRSALSRWCKVRGRADSMRAIRRVAEHPRKMWRLESDMLHPLMTPARGEQPWNRPSQVLPRTYVQTAGLEMAWTRVLDMQSISGNRIAGFRVHGPAALDINIPEDLWIAERLVGDEHVRFGSEVSVGSDAR